MGAGPWVPGPLGLLIAMEIFHDVNLGFGPGPWFASPLGLLIAMEIFHDVNLRFGPRSLGPRLFWLGYSSPWKYSMMRV